MKKWILFICLALFGALVCRAQTEGIAGEWDGIWTSPSGFVYKAQITLNTGSGCKTCAVVGDGSIQGEIVWTLQRIGKNAPAQYTGSEGLTATEYVKGEMRGDGFFVIEGYRKDDPHNIIGLDRYRLALGENGKVIGGITRNNGPWTGQLIAVRVP